MTVPLTAEGLMVAKPFLKWVGGKRALLPVLLAHVPETFTAYHEPFVGGGALFFALASAGRLAGHPVTLSDVNADLITTYTVVRDDPEALIASLEVHAKAHTKDAKATYYAIRSLHTLTDPVAIAARLIYLNRTCFNGLYRVNRRGEFNVPLGRSSSQHEANDTTPDIVRAEVILAAHQALQGVSLRCQPFGDCKPAPGDFVYCDPPYDPLTATADFTAYAQQGFGPNDQQALSQWATKQSDSGVKLLLSNADTPRVRDWYAGWQIETVAAPRFVSARASSRLPVGEVVIR